MLDCIDLYSGAGGLSVGLMAAGVRVTTAVDHDGDAIHTYRTNIPNVRALNSRVQELESDDLLKGVRNRERLIIAGGPPCTLFSRLHRNPADTTSEIETYCSIIRDVRPAFVVLENVPAIQRRSRAWSCIRATLEESGYLIEARVINCSDFGVAQARQRMIVLAGRRRVQIPSIVPERVRTVRDAIGHLPEKQSGIPNHVSLQLSAQNLERIKRLAEGQRSRGKTRAFSDSYSRMAWDKPAPTITTKCISFSNGRFGHPSYDRGLTVREAATLQGFPEDFVFHGSLWSCARQVGNAVPPPVAEAIGRELVKAARRRRVRRCTVTS
ncbi:DNA cytosine methyltransferase [Maioricimonas sp. JC845]|uniref:DNA cytosine methyltransferase n=1 Tax=Maioricimonas sp. JC845 TaxID=3232138 RepID=UPI0034578AC7